MMGRERESDRQVEWTPRTELGRKVKSGEIASYDALYEKGVRILEPQMINHLLPNLQEEVLEVTNTQRMTAYGRKQQMRAIVCVGDTSGYVGVGIGKAADSRDAIAEAITDAKKKLVKVQLGCASWECNCGTSHTIMRECKGQNSSTEITLKPAPRGVGIVSNETAKKVLALAGVRDVWTFTKGRTRNILNMALATIDAINAVNKLKNQKG